jgi:hypothetical protein
MTLLQVIDVYPPGSIVSLGNDQIGIVVRNNPNSPTRPILKTIDPQTKKLEKEINLLEDLTLFIKKVLPRLP